MVFNINSQNYNFKLVTERINGGLNGEDNRLKYYARALTEFAQS